MTNELDQPYPLKRYFRLWILPAFLALAVLIPAFAGWGGAGLIESVYLILAERRAQVIDRAVKEELSEPWLNLKASDDPARVFAALDGKALLKALDDEVLELDLEQLKIYGRDGIILYDSGHLKIGNTDASSAYVAAMTSGHRSAILKPLPDGSSLYELYVRLPDADGAPPVVFELYEPATELNRLLFIAAAPVALVAAVMLLVITWGLSRLVSKAQGEINARTEMLTEVRAKLEGFVSSRAVTAAHDSIGSGEIVSERVELTLLYSDIRGFTAYSESIEAEAVVTFLNTIMGLQIDIVNLEGGDVDKMIGDALLVRFDGDNKEQRALSAAIEIQKKLAASDMPCGLGIGVYTGDVISGVIGPAERQDFTVIGDSVNTSARLCAAAARDEVVVDAQTVAVAHRDDLGPIEDISVKGKRKNVSVRRWRLS